MKAYPVRQARFGAAVSAMLFTAWAGGARAQEGDHIVIGVGVSDAPAYQGSDNYRVLPLPAISIKEGIFFADLRNGIGITPIDTNTVTIGASAVFVQGYRESDVPTGVDKLSDSAGARIFATLHTNGFNLTFGATKSVTGGTKGITADAYLTYPIALSPRFTLIPSVGTTWANRKYNDRYFGITAAEAVASDLPQFSTGSGFKDASASLTAVYRLTDHINVSATGSITTLLGNVKDSPLVVKKAEPSGFLAMSYRF